MHYRTQCCGDHDPVKLSRLDDEDFLSRLTRTYIREMFEERNVSEAQRRKLWRFYNSELNEALDTGYSPEIKEYYAQLAQQLKFNVAEFSAFKETSFKAQLEAALVDDAGNIRSWRDFRNAANDLGIQYNQRWLKTEFNQTVANAQSVERWKQIEADQDLYPNLKYMTIGDGRVREQHKDWHGLILPVNHEFWATHNPPNDWGCRCYVVQTIEDPNRTNESFAKPKADFAHNPAKSGKVFKENAYEKGLSQADALQAKKLAKENLIKENLKKQRVEVRDWAKTNLVGNIVRHPKIGDDIKFTVSGIKEAINQPHKFILAKNEAIKNIEELIKNAELAATIKDEKGKGFTYHYLRTIIQGEQSFIIIRKAHKETAFYSIVEKIRE